MARKVKCVDTGEFSTNDVAYKAVNGKYYSSESAYNNIEKQNEERIRCIEYMMDVLGYEQGMKLPTIFYKKLNELASFKFENVFDTFVAQRSSIDWALTNKNFATDVGKINYIMAIVQNNVMDTYRSAKQRERQEQSVSVKIDEIIPQISVPTRPRQTTNKKDIRRFLEDDEQ